MRFALAALLLGASFATPAAAQTERWMLMARHGECAEIASLKRKIPDLGEVADPAAFVERMRRSGYQVSSADVALAGGRAVEVRVPEKELSLIFVAAGLCGKKP
jgi:hypothetical protein